MNEELLKKFIIEEISSLLKEQEEVQAQQATITPDLLQQAIKEWNQIKNMALGEDSAILKVLEILKRSPDVRTQFFYSRWVQTFAGNAPSVYKDVALVFNELSSRLKK